MNKYGDIYGANTSETVVLNHAAVTDWEFVYWEGFQQVNMLWDGDYYASGGDDVIIRDRPGLYRLNHGWDGDAEMHGGEGTDTISYAHYTGAIDIDLSTPEGYGVAKAKGLSGQEIFGVDKLHDIENAIGTGGHDKITGSNGVNMLAGANGNDEIKGEGGNDTLLGGNHNDKLDGGSGNDTVKGESGNDTARGGANNDIVEGGSGNDILYGDSGSDFLYGGTGFNVLWGGTGNDVLLLEGSGHAHGDEGVDKLLGGDGNDKLYGGTGLDEIDGGSGNDTITGGANSDDLRGGGGTDTAVWEGSARVVIELGPVGMGTAVQSGFTDSLLGIENFRTGSGNDKIMLGGAANYVDAGDGSDYINTGGGNDAVLAGDGNDGVASGLGQDSIQAGDGDDWMMGEGGNDTLSGGDGEDYVNGGAGTDTLFGGNDADQFVFRTGDTGMDNIRDFVLGEDMIRFGGFLTDEPEIGESYVGRVYAAAADSGHSVMLVAVTDDGLQAFAKIVGNGNVASFNNAIADGSLFNPSLLNGDSPMDIGI